MNLTYKIKDVESYLEFNKICLIFGANNSGKSTVLFNIKNYIENGSNNILIDGNKVSKNDYKVVYFDEESDFNNEFKFTKTNLFRSIIYDDILKKVNEEKILKEINNLFDVIDTKVNKYIHSKLSKFDIDDLYFDTNFTDISKVIEKFTDIYFNDFLLTSNNIPKNIKRILIYQLLFLTLENNINEDTIVIIDNFDVYLDYENTIEIINLLSKYSKKYDNVHFILSTHKNIYNLLNDNFAIYKMTNNSTLINYKEQSLIKEYLSKQNYVESKSKLVYEAFKEKNKVVVNDDDINYTYKNLLLPNKEKLGNLLINCNLEILNINNKNIKFDKPFILTQSTNEQLFFEIAKKLLT